jgi:ribosomal protein L37E
MSEHRIVAVTLIGVHGLCPRCGPNAPHNIVAYCACGETATGMTDHIWTVTARDGDRLTLSPSFNWLHDPSDASNGSHLHEYVVGIPDTKMHATIEGGAR